MSTPLRAQYCRLKRPFPDALLLFRLGDVYELYGEDATISAHELGLAVTTHEFADGERVPLCSLPYRAVEGHVRRLAARGYKVAIGEQIGDPCIVTGLVERAVVRVVTPRLAIGGHGAPEVAVAEGVFSKAPGPRPRPEVIAEPADANTTHVPLCKGEKTRATPASGDGEAVQLMLFSCG